MVMMIREDDGDDKGFFDKLSGSFLHEIISYYIVYFVVLYYLLIFNPSKDLQDFKNLLS